MKVVSGFLEFGIRGGGGAATVLFVEVLFWGLI